ncbi:MAG: hypothetical protein M3Q47_06160 [Actinomycetota bacterium]|nr:hypothetical protein [Actinomycetota bacterium]
MTSARARHNSLRRYRPADDPEVLAARRDLRAARLADYIERVVSEAPPLTNEQREKLAMLLSSSRSAGGAAT